MGDDHYAPINPDRIPFGPVDQEVGVIRIEDTNGQAPGHYHELRLPCGRGLPELCDLGRLPGSGRAEGGGGVWQRGELPLRQWRRRQRCPVVHGPAQDGPNDPFKTDYAPMERMGELLAYETVKVAKSLRGQGEETTIKYRDAALAFTGRFDPARHFDVRITTILINDDIVIAANPGELFAELGLEWKAKMQARRPIPFTSDTPGTRASGPDMSRASRAPPWADSAPTRIAGSSRSAREKPSSTNTSKNYFRLTGLMRSEPGPSGFKRGAKWIVTPVPEEAAP